MSRPLSFQQALERARALRVRTARAEDLLTSERSMHLHARVYRWLPPLAARWLREFAEREGLTEPHHWDEAVEKRYHDFLVLRLAARSLNPYRKWPQLTDTSSERGSFLQK